MQSCYLPHKLKRLTALEFLLPYYTFVVFTVVVGGHWAGSAAYERIPIMGLVGKCINAMLWWAQAFQLLIDFRSKQAGEDIIQYMAIYNPHYPHL